MNYRMAQEERSYVEVTRKNKPVKEVENSGSTMSWSDSYEEEEWLSKIAIGILKDFGSVEKGYVDRDIFDRLLLPMGNRDSYDGDRRCVRDTEDVRKKCMGKNGDRMDSRKEVRELVS
ncbi:hypothetical protein QYF36_007270 [Acer negundo]|nr:hypothetical protein QYF36_007270 [Acer negundo]